VRRKTAEGLANEAPALAFLVATMKHLVTRPALDQNNAFVDWALAVAEALGAVRSRFLVFLPQHHLGTFSLLLGVLLSREDAM
jgi:hypothetical protein